MNGFGLDGKLFRKGLIVTGFFAIQVKDLFKLNTVQKQVVGFVQCYKDL